MKLTKCVPFAEPAIRNASAKDQYSMFQGLNTPYWLIWVITYFWSQERSISNEDLWCYRVRGAHMLENFI